MWVTLAWSIAGALLNVVGTMAGRVLLGLGLGFVTYKGADVAVVSIFTKVKESFGGMQGEVVQFLAFMWVDKGISVIFSAFVVALAIKTAAGGLTSLRARKP